MRESGEKLRVFISYSHNDKGWLDRLKVHLKPLIRDYNLEVWDDTGIDVGEEWFNKIEESLKTSQVSMLLISADFLASEFINNEELPKILQILEEGGSSLLPIIISPCLFSSHKTLSRFQAVNSPSKPLISLEKGEQEAIFVKVAEHLEVIAKRYELRKVKEQIEGQEEKIRNQQQVIRLIYEALKRSLTQHEFQHLVDLMPENPSSDYKHSFFLEMEMIRLCQHGYVKENYHESTWKMKERGDTEFDLKEFYHIQDEGKEYLNLLQELETVMN